MYPQPQLNSYLQGLNTHMPKKIINRTVDKAFEERCGINDCFSRFNRLVSVQPQCFAPHVDVTRAKCAFKQFALPKLIKDLSSSNSLTVRQAITTLGDLMHFPEKLTESVRLNVVENLTEFLESGDPYLRERVAMIFVTIANQAKGREAILNNINTMANLLKGLDDRLAAVRLQVAQVLESLASNYLAAEKMSMYGFSKIISDKLNNERKDILILYLDILELLFHQSKNNAPAFKNGSFEQLVKLLKRKDENVLTKSLNCLGILCEDPCGKQKAIEMDLLCDMKKLLSDERESVNVGAARVVSFITITTPGKLRLLELKMAFPLLLKLTQKCCPSQRMVLVIIKILTNVAEAPEGRAMLLQYDSLIEGVTVDKDNEPLQRHKQTLLDVIRWRP